MFKLSYIENLAILFLLLISFILGQDRIIEENINLEEVHRNSTLENNVIPEQLLIRLQDARNVSDLFRRFVVREENILFDENDRGNRTGIRRTQSVVAPVTIAQPANCQTEQHLVELDKPENAATIFWPSCVRVRRCGGCCTSKLLVCRPLETSILNITVLKMQYNHQNPDSFESQGTRIFSLEQHDRCACTCKEGPEDCDPDLQDYRASECRCVCRNSDESTSCSGPKKIWDSTDCTCKCRNVRMCSSGRYFNIVNCRCEVLRLSLSIENLDQLTSNLSLTLQASTLSPDQGNSSLSQTLQASTISPDESNSTLSRVLQIMTDSP